MELNAKITQSIIKKTTSVDDLTDPELAAFCIEANLKYRAGEPIIIDKDYDFIYLAALKKRLPEHQLLQQIEPEGGTFSEEKVLLPQPMLSTDKAYTFAEIEKWCERLEKAGIEIDLASDKIQIIATPKLDGFAGFDDGKRLYTRGDGKKGSDISRVFARGLCVFNDSKRGQGAGEIVVKKSYFKANLADKFEYPRNFQASLIKEKALNIDAQKAIDKKAALFVPFAELPHWKGAISALKSEFEAIVAEVLHNVDFDVDGVVFEATNADLKAQMGANRKFHRWQIAFKENQDKAEVEVLSITPQVGRTGKITPVAELAPTLLSGAKIMRATGHHYGLVKQQGLGAGSIIELTRSGMVIPKINKVLKSVKPELPNSCPSCDKKLVWEADFLICPNHQNCPDQIIGKIEYFFKILANNDGFGRKTIEKLYKRNIRKISEVFALTEADFQGFGFGEKTSKNLKYELNRARKEQVEDWRFLAAFGLPRMGRGNSENLLKSCDLSDVFSLNAEQITGIDGFAELSADIIVAGFTSIKAEFLLLNPANFNLEKTLKTADLPTQTHPLFGKKVVFSGAMSAPRTQMQKQAKALGIKVASSISKTTDLLITGANIGAKKLKTAQSLNIKTITEQDYLKQITEVR